MKFRDPRTKEVIDLESEVSDRLCTKIECDFCPLRSKRNGTNMGCNELIAKFPEKAAALMGYEAVEQEPTWAERLEASVKHEEKDNMNKPRICEVLGVEVNEEFTYTFGENQVNRGTFKIGEDGARYYKTGTGQWNLCYNEEDLLTFINRPDYIIRKPRFTQQDIEDAKMIRAVLDKNGFIKRYDNSDLVFNLIHINKNLFPSIKECQEYSLDEIIGSGEQS